MAAAELGFHPTEEYPCQALSGVNLENSSHRVKQKEAITNIVVLKKDSLIYFTDRLWEVFSVVALCFLLLARSKLFRL